MNILLEKIFPPTHKKTRSFFDQIKYWSLPSVRQVRFQSDYIYI